MLVGHNVLLLHESGTVLGIFNLNFFYIHDLFV